MQIIDRVVHVPAGQGEKVWVVGDTYTLKVTSDRTGGRLGMIEASVPAGGGPPPHVHAAEDEAFYVLEGELEFLGGERTFRAGPGSFVFIPRGTLHRFRNVGYGHARALVVFTPGGFEAFFAAVGQAARPGEPAPPLGEPEIARTLALAPEFGMDVRVPAPPG
jgi:quercetin dioxygenase-like cupin family protein